MQRRVLAAFLLSLAAFILSILTLTAGSNPNFLPQGALVTSDDGQPRPDHTPDILDWVSVYYLNQCFGYYEPGTGIRTNVTCERIENREYLLERAYIPWVAGTALIGFVALIYPIFLGGRVHWNGVPFFLLLISWIALMLGATLGTIYGYDDPPAKPGKDFIPMSWTAVICILIALVIQAFEHGLQKFTPKGRVISAEYKPANVAWVGYNRRMAMRMVRHDLNEMT